MQVGLGVDNVSMVGYQVARCNLEEVLGVVFSAIRSGKYGGYVACANPHSLALAGNDEAFSASLRAATILLPDGAGLLLGARILGLPIKERIAGFEFFQGLSHKANQSKGARYFFLGSTCEVLERLRERMSADYPEIGVCGTYSPPFKDFFTDEENAAMIAAVNKAAPDVLWVGMTAPKQEKWIYANRHRLNVPLICAVGAVFDFYAGTRYRAPKWVRDFGLEWLPRLILDPKRLWRRTFVSAPIFFFKVLQQRFGKRFPEVSSQ